MQAKILSRIDHNEGCCFYPAKFKFSEIIFKDLQLYDQLELVIMLNMSRYSHSCSKCMFCSGPYEDIVSCAKVTKVEDDFLFLKDTPIVYCYKCVENASEKMNTSDGVFFLQLSWATKALAQKQALLQAALELIRLVQTYQQTDQMR